MTSIFDVDLSSCEDKDISIYKLAGILFSNNKNNLYILFQ